MSKELDTTIYLNDIQLKKLSDAIRLLRYVCSESMLPLEDIGFNGQLNVKSIYGIELTNRLLSEDNIGHEEQK